MQVSLDCEYSDLNLRKAHLLSASIGTDSSEILFKTNELSDVKYITDKAKIVFVQNGGVDWFILKKAGIEVDRSKFMDCMILEHLIDERIDHDLGSMALRYFGDNYKKEFWSKYITFDEAPEPEAEEYERKDVRYTYDLGVKFLAKLKGKEEVIHRMHRLYWTLFDTEMRGIIIDKELLDKTEVEMRGIIEGLLPKLRAALQDYCDLWEMQKWEEEKAKRVTERGKAGVRRPQFNFNSDPQLKELLYDKEYLKLPVIHKTKTGNPSTDYDTLLELSKTYPRILPLVEYKNEKAVYATFVKGLQNRLEGDRVHPHFSVTGTETGRLSSSNPNFQNMPQEGPVRTFILPEPGCVIVGADFDSLEVGVELNLTDDPALKSIMLDKKSKHDITAEAVGMPRKDAKTLNFLCQYGGGVWKIKDTFKVSEKEAQGIYDRYWKAYAGVVAYKQKVFADLARTNEVTNIAGKTRHLIPPRNEYQKSKNERKAYSHMVQGPGAEMCNMASYLVDDYLKQTGYGIYMFSVHDEIVCSAKKEYVHEVKSAIVRIMESTNEILGFKYAIKAKPYGPFDRWQKA